MPGVTLGLSYKQVCLDLSTFPVFQRLVLGFVGKPMDNLPKSIKKILGKKPSCPKKSTYCEQSGKRSRDSRDPRNREEVMHSKDLV